MKILTISPLALLATIMVAGACADAVTNDGGGASDSAFSGVEPAPSIAETSQVGRLPASDTVAADADFVRTLSPTLSVIRATINEELGIRIVFARFDRASFRPRVAGLARDEPSGRSGQSVAQDSNTVVVVGSGFVTGFYPPTPAGLLIVGGELVSPVFRGGYSTVVLVRDGVLTLAVRDSLPSLTSVSGALQTGPRLVQNGKSSIFANEPQMRAPATRGFLALCEDAAIAVGITETATSLYELAEFLSRPVTRNGLGCTDAVNLSGGGAELLVVRSPDGQMVYSGGNTTVRQAAVIAFSTR